MQQQQRQCSSSLTHIPFLLVQPAPYSLPSTQDGVRYVRDGIRQILGIMGVKHRHAIKVAHLVFQRVSAQLPELAKPHHRRSPVCMHWAVWPFSDWEVCVSLPRSDFHDLLCSCLSEYNYKCTPSSDELKVACSLKERRKCVVVLICGTSGSGKSTLASILASRLGITTVISTDSIRHMLRSFTSKEESPLLYASTYQAGDALPPSFRAAFSKQQPPSQQQQQQQPAEGESTAAGNALERAILGYKAQCEPVVHRLDALITDCEARKQSLVVEGVHLSIGLVIKLMQRHPSVVPFLVYIKNEAKHVERMAVRAKYMTLDPQKNRYVAHMGCIRWIQDYLVRKADLHCIPKVENSNVDQSVGLIHIALTGMLRRTMRGEAVLDPKSNTTRVLQAELRAAAESLSTTSKAIVEQVRTMRLVDPAHAASASAPLPSTAALPQASPDAGSQQAPAGGTNITTAAGTDVGAAHTPASAAAAATPATPRPMPTPTGVHHPYHVPRAASPTAAKATDPIPCSFVSSAFEEAQPLPAGAAPAPLSSLEPELGGCLSCTVGCDFWAAEEGITVSSAREERAAATFAPSAAPAAAAAAAAAAPGASAAPAPVPQLPGGSPLNKSIAQAQEQPCPWQPPTFSFHGLGSVSGGVGGAGFALPLLDTIPKQPSQPAGAPGFRFLEVLPGAAAPRTQRAPSLLTPRLQQQQQQEQQQQQQQQQQEAAAGVSTSCAGGTAETSAAAAAAAAAGKGQLGILSPVVGSPALSSQHQPPCRVCTDVGSSDAQSHAQPPASLLDPGDGACNLSKQQQQQRGWLKEQQLVAAWAVRGQNQQQLDRLLPVPAPPQQSLHPGCQPGVGVTGQGTGGVHAGVGAGVGAGEDAGSEAGVSAGVHAPGAQSAAAEVRAGLQAGERAGGVATGAVETHARADPDAVPAQMPSAHLHQASCREASGAQATAPSSGAAAAADSEGAQRLQGQQQQKAHPSTCQPPQPYILDIRQPQQQPQQQQQQPQQQQRGPHVQEHKGFNRTDVECALITGIDSGSGSSKAATVEDMERDDVFRENSVAMPRASSRSSCMPSATNGPSSSAHTHLPLRHHHHHVSYHRQQQPPQPQQHHALQQQAQQQQQPQQQQPWRSTRWMGRRGAKLGAHWSHTTPPNGTSPAQPQLHSTIGSHEANAPATSTSPASPPSTPPGSSVHHSQLPQGVKISSGGIGSVHASRALQGSGSSSELAANNSSRVTTPVKGKPVPQDACGLLISDEEEEDEAMAAMCCAAAGGVGTGEPGVAGGGGPGRGPLVLEGGFPARDSVSMIQGTCFSTPPNWMQRSPGFVVPNSESEAEPSYMLMGYGSLAESTAAYDDFTEDGDDLHSKMSSPWASNTNIISSLHRHGRNRESSPALPHTPSPRQNPQPSSPPLSPAPAVALSRTLSSDHAVTHQAKRSAEGTVGTAINPGALCMQTQEGEQAHQRIQQHPATEAAAISSDDRRQEVGSCSADLNAVASGNSSANDAARLGASQHSSHKPSHHQHQQQQQQQQHRDPHQAQQQHHHHPSPRLILRSSNSTIVRHLAGAMARSRMRANAHNAHSGLHLPTPSPPTLHPVDASKAPIAATAAAACLLAPERMSRKAKSPSHSYSSAPTTPSRSANSTFEYSTLPLQAGVPAGDHNPFSQAPASGGSTVSRGMPFGAPTPSRMHSPLREPSAPPSCNAATLSPIRQSKLPHQPHHALPRSRHSHNIHHRERESIITSRAEARQQQAAAAAAAEAQSEELRVQAAEELLRSAGATIKTSSSRHRPAALRDCVQ